MCSMYVDKSLIRNSLEMADLSDIIPSLLRIFCNIDILDFFVSIKIRYFRKILLSYCEPQPRRGKILGECDARARRERVLGAVVDTN